MTDASTGLLWTPPAKSGEIGRHESKAARTQSWLTPPAIIQDLALWLCAQRQVSMIPFRAGYSTGREPVPIRSKHSNQATERRVLTGSPPTCP
jgi:hypothetical protein